MDSTNGGALMQNVARNDTVRSVALPRRMPAAMPSGMPKPSTSTTA